MARGDWICNRYLYTTRNIKLIFKQYTMTDNKIKLILVAGKTFGLDFKKISDGLNLSIEQTIDLFGDENYWDNEFWTKYLTVKGAKFDGEFWWLNNEIVL